MTEVRTWKRIRNRLELRLPVRVHCRETPDFEWIEITRLVNVTPFGAGFTLKRPTEKGRLLHMTIPMPRQLRVFDYVEDQYRIWAIVRYLRSVSEDLNQPLFGVGAAFIGKKPPSSYERDPSRRYEVSQPQGQSQSVYLTTDISPKSTSDQRATLYNIPVDLLLELLDEKNSLVKSEQTVTENLSQEAATIFTTLDIPIGRFIRLTSEQYRVSLFAVVRSRSTGSNGIPRVHVEFVDRQWPLF